jgi:hypothetical protein
MKDLPFEIWLALSFFTFIGILASFALAQHVHICFLILTALLMICLMKLFQYNKKMMDKYGHVADDPYA